MKKPDSMLKLRFPSTTKTLEYASKFIKRTIPQAEYWISNRHRWMHNIPTEECDVVITLAIGIEDNTLMWLLTRLKGRGLNVRIQHNPITNCYQCYLTAALEILLKCAEEHHLPKRLSAMYGGGLKEFLRSEQTKFEGYDNESEFFTMHERQWLILRLLETLRTNSDEVRSNVKFIPGQAIIPNCLLNGIIAQIYPVHEMQSLKYLRKTWVRSIFNVQPIDDIADYFGVKIAMYFAWLGHYTRALSIPAIVGLIFWTVSFCRVSQTFMDSGFVFFSFFNVIWFSIYLETWKRYCSELAYKWGTLDQRDELLAEPRPLFVGPLAKSSVTGRSEPQYLPWKRNLFRYLVSIPAISVCISVVVGVMIISFKLQDWWDKEIALGGYFHYFNFLPKIMLGIVISFLDEIYYKIACWLNDKENYRLNREYENNLIVKVATFQFVNSFISLFYIAFYLQDQERLKVQLAVLLITRQIIQNIKESALPFLIEQFRLAKLSFDIFGAISPAAIKEKKQFEEPHKSKIKKKYTESSTIPQAEVESTLFKFEGTFSKHLEISLQLGYVVLFSSAFPMAAFCALINNLVEIRSDAFKMCFIYQRPFGERVSNIGMWLNMMDVMGLIAILVNCALIGLSGQVHRMFPDMSKTQTILLIVALEHVMLAMRFITSCIIPDKPEWVATEMAKVEFARREALNRLSTTASPRAVVTPVTTSTDVDTTSQVENINQLYEIQNSDDESFVDSYHFQPVERVGDTDLCNDFVESESDLSQSVDNIDRILRNIEEETNEHESMCSKFEDRYRDDTSEINLKRRLPQLLNLSHGHKPSKMRQWATSLDQLNQDKIVNVANISSTASPARDNLLSHRSTSCIVTSPKDSHAASSTSELRYPTSVINKQDSGGSETSSATDDPVTDVTEKRKKLRSALIKRARSVAVFSLKLKEKRTKPGWKEIERGKEKVSPKKENPRPIGGELSCVPIEMLISMDDVNLKAQSTKKNVTVVPKAATMSTTPFLKH